MVKIYFLLLILVFGNTIALAQPSVGSVVVQIESILGSSLDRSSKKTRLSHLISNLNSSDLETYSWLAWISQNMDDFVRQRTLRRLVVLSTQFGEFARTDHDSWSASSNDHEIYAAFQLKAAIQKQHLDLLGQFGKSNYDEFPSLSPADRDLFLSRIKNQITRVVHDSEFRNREAVEFRQNCDTKLSRIFGGGTLRAAGMGEEPFQLSYSASVQDFLNPPKRIQLHHLPRFHLIASLHVYSDPQGDSETAPLFAPPGGTNPRGSSTGNANHTLSYRKLGRLKDVDLKIAHLADPDFLFSQDGSQERNAMGSVRIGSSGGPGGGGKLGNSNYFHSHLMIWSRDGKRRFSFVDAFCKSQ